SLSPGVYSASSAMSLTGTVTLVGDANSVFIFQAVSSLTANPGSNVVLSGGVRACNVFWQVGSSATLDTTSAFAGTILALTSISMKTGATLQGRALARNGAVTLDDNTITTSTCSVVALPVTTTTVATTTTTKGSTTTTPKKSTTTTTKKSTTKTTKKSRPIRSATPKTTTTQKGTTVARKRHAGSSVTTTTAPALIGAPVTGGGPTPSHGSPWLWVALAGIVTGSALFLGSDGRRRRTDRR
ncbi:MAG: ice-binding family protein, partial [Acidimicrobiales bacterium]